MSLNEYSRDHTMIHGLDQLLSAALGGGFASRPLSPVEEARIKILIGQVQLRTGRTTFVSCCLVGIIGVAAWATSRFLDGPAANPVLDTRSEYRLLGAAILLVALGSLAHAAHLRRTRRLMGPDLELFDLHHAKKFGWMPRRWMIVCAAVGLLGSPLALCATLCLGERIDDRGLLFARTLLQPPRLTTHDHIARLELFDTRVGRNGTVFHMPVLRLHLDDGSRHDLRPDGPSARALPAAAALISARSGVAVEQSGTYPP